MKAGTKYETNKVTGTDIFPRMDNRKLKNKPAVDCRSAKRVLVSGAKKPPPKRRTHTISCHSNHTQCQVGINLLMSHITNHWYLSAVGILGHEFHTSLDAEHQHLSERDCDKEDVDLMQVMYSVDIPPATIAKIMSEVRRKKGQSGYFISKTLRNASIKHENTMAHLDGFDKDWKTAEKLIADLAL